MYFIRKKKINICITLHTLIKNTFGEQRLAFIGYNLDIRMIEKSYRFDIEFLYF